MWHWPPKAALPGIGLPDTCTFLHRHRRREVLVLQDVRYGERAIRPGDFFTGLYDAAATAAYCVQV